MTVTDDLTVDALVRACRDSTTIQDAVATLRRSGFDDDAVVRILLGGGSDRGPGTDRATNADRIVALLTSRGGEIRSVAGECVPTIAEMLGLPIHSVHKALLALASQGRIDRDVDNAGTRRVALREAVPA